MKFTPPQLTFYSLDKKVIELENSNLAKEEIAKQIT